MYVIVSIYFFGLKHIAKTNAQFKNISFVKEQGLNIGELTNNRLGKLMRDLDVIENKERKIIERYKILFYYLVPEKIKMVAENYRVK
jgi:hypothetical protein